MRMELVGMTRVREGTSKGGKAYLTCDLHFIGKTSSVQGVTVAKVYVDLLDMINPPTLQIGNKYDLDISDKGYLRNLELLEEKAETASPESEEKAETDAPKDETAETKSEEKAETAAPQKPEGKK